MMAGVLHRVSDEDCGEKKIPKGSFALLMSKRGFTHTTTPYHYHYIPGPLEQERGRGGVAWCSLFTEQGSKRRKYSGAVTSVYAHVKSSSHARGINVYGISSMKFSNGSFPKCCDK